MKQSIDFVIDKTKSPEFIAYGIIFILIFLSLVIPIKHDYWVYIRQWPHVFEGNDPNHPYGIIFSLFCFPYYLYFKLPSAIFVSTYLLACILFFRSSGLDFATGNGKWFYLAILNPLFIIFGVAYGNNGAFLAGLVLISMLLLERGRNISSGFLFALAINFKFMPIVIVPLLFIRSKKINYEFLISTVLFTFVIIFIGYLVWGSAIFDPITFGANRPSKLFSIFRYLRGEFSFFHDVDFLSVPLVIAGWLFTLLLSIRYNFSNALSAVLVLSVVLMLYKVGHIQFYLSYFLLFLYFCVKHSEALRKEFIPVILGFALFIWIFLFSILYHETGWYSGNFSIIREFVGLPTFLIQLLFIFSLVHFGITNYKRI